jgi:hypothetical protein
VKREQLANVLLKIIGLYVCVCTIPGLIAGILALFPSIFTPTSGVPQSTAAKINDILFRALAWAIGDAVKAVVGICLIIKSRKIAGFWFKNEEE